MARTRGICWKTRIRRPAAWCWLLVALTGSSTAVAQGMRWRGQTGFRSMPIRLGPDRAGSRYVHRAYQNLQVEAWRLGSGAWQVASGLRYQLELGDGFRRDQAGRSPTSPVEDARVAEIQYLHASYRAQGVLLRFGRQYVIDDLSWYTFDGVLGAFRLWRPTPDRTLQVTMYAGRPVRFDELLASENFVLDGTDVDDGYGLLSGWVLGGRLALTGGGAFQAVVSFRQELERRGDALAAFDGAGGAARSEGSIGLQSSVVGGSLGYRIRPARTHIGVTGAWDAVLNVLDDLQLASTTRLGAGLVLRARYLRARPRFAANSIFNYFNSHGYDHASITADARLSRRMSLFAGWSSRYFPSATGTGAESPGAAWTHAPRLGVELGVEAWRFGVDWEADVPVGESYAFGGNYQRASAWARRSVWQDRLHIHLGMGGQSTQDDWVGSAAEAPIGDRLWSYWLQVRAWVELADFLQIAGRYQFVGRSRVAGNYLAALELGWRYGS